MEEEQSGGADKVTGKLVLTGDAKTDWALSRLSGILFDIARNATSQKSENTTERREKSRHSQGGNINRRSKRSPSGKDRKQRG